MVWKNHLVCLPLVLIAVSCHSQKVSPASCVSIWITVEEKNLRNASGDNCSNLITPYLGTLIWHPHFYTRPLPCSLNLILFSVLHDSVGHEFKWDFFKQPLWFKGNNSQKQQNSPCCHVLLFHFLQLPVKFGIFQQKCLQIEDLSVNY